MAFVLRAVTHPITEVFAGAAIPRAVAEWSTRRQLRAKLRSERLFSPDDRGGMGSPAAATAQWLGRRFPVDDADMQPTLFGNVLASAGEHPRFAYSMEGALWWPRLAPLLPASFQDALTGALAPMIALLNLSAVFFALGVLALALGPLGSLWTAALAILAIALVLSWLGYRAAVSQATEVGKMLCLAFDLYRYDILDQLGLDHPADLASERTLWLRLTREILALPESAPGVNASPDSR